MAPFETFAEHAARSHSESPYGDAFITRCRSKALEYAKEDAFLRGTLLSDLKKCIPLHFQGKVFEGISFINPAMAN
jgi:hypothetical protein